MKNRGVTLVATVLLSAIAATIALVLVRQTVLIGRDEAVRGDYDSAYQSALDVKRQFDRELAEDPQFVFKRLFAYERPRLCDGEPVVGPTEPDKVDESNPDAPQNTVWPQDCPRTWTYVPAETVEGYDPQTRDVRVEIDPPTALDPTMTVRFLADLAGTETGLTATYRTSSATSVTAWSGSDLHLEDLTDANADGIRGVFYAAGRTYLPTARDLDLTGAQFLTEAGFVGTYPLSGHLYSTDPTKDTAGTGSAGDGTAGDGTDEAGTTVGDIRAMVSDSMTLEELRASYPRLETVGCPAATPEPVRLDDTSFATSLCLRHGTDLVDTDDRPVVTSTTGTEAGARPAAYLLLFSGTKTEPSVKVYTADSAPSAVGECLLRCDLSSLAAADFAAGRHPASAPAQVRSTGDLSNAPLWQPLGEFPLPATGVVLTDADTYVGRCPQAIDPAAGCEETVARRSVTVVAGTPNDPRDLVLSGPSRAADGAQLGLVATKSVVVPYYARKPGTDLTIEANIAAYGYPAPGAADVAGLVTFPSTQASYAEAAGNYGATVTFRGSVAAPSTSAALPGWRNVRFQADSDSAASPPPYFPGFTETWMQLGTERLTPFEACGHESCAGIW